MKPDPDVSDAGEVIPAASSTSLIGALVRTARPKQWIKNVLVAAAPGAAGVLGERTALGRTALAFIAFCFVASATYFFNDAADVEQDRLHPTKRARPVAAGALTPLVARIAGGVFAVAGLLAAAALRDWRFFVVVGVYLALTTLYTHVLKTIAVLDIAGVASGYIIRAVAGAVATQVPLSNWFAIVTSFGSLFMVAGRRSAEHLDAGVEPALHRSTLAKYSADYLRYVRGVSSAIAITAYCLWAFERSGIGTRVPWFEFSILPFVLAILRYALLIDEGKGGTPEDIVFSDRAMPVLGIVWAALVTAGIYIR